MNDQPSPLKSARLIPRRSGPLAAMRASFLTGLIVIAPIGITVWLIWTLTGWMDSWVLPLIPPRWRPENYIGINLRGLGVVVFLIFTLLIGWAARGWMGKAIIGFGESLFSRMPIVGAVYGGIKQIAETILSQGDGKFDRACLVEYPRRGLWGIGFVAGDARGEIAQKGSGSGHGKFLAVFVPTTPNPTSGFLLFVPEQDVHILDMAVEDAAKLVISGGLVYPSDTRRGNSADISTESR
ncbi:DUF502 domain-containing protein [Paracoccus aerodenitrificans]|uniref:DUF502 domain-containing protein n=1 Tax=Paracoccus aerodenitrificans TaxID=3017781 RepID=UPI0022F0385A|nr:DUF502 domain-containing protein [Paracoccus aerodenitrificans]WBU65521.1 DUF502 domain-containing protein [Paracoccus aerodenitrificans]